MFLLCCISCYLQTAWFLLKVSHCETEGFVFAIWFPAVACRLYMLRAMTGTPTIMFLVSLKKGWGGGENGLGKGYKQDGVWAFFSLQEGQRLWLLGLQFWKDWPYHWQGPVQNRNAGPLDQTWWRSSKQPREAWFKPWFPHTTASLLRGQLFPFRFFSFILAWMSDRVA